MDIKKFVYKGTEILEKDFTEELHKLHAEYAKVETDMKNIIDNNRQIQEALFELSGIRKYLESKINPILEKIIGDKNETNPKP